MENSEGKTYKSNEITIIWKPQKCIHAGVCVQKLPGVYNPKARPWIKPENASTKALKEQIELCPSGALSYVLNNEILQKETNMEEVKIQVLKDGPLLVNGKLEITRPDGQKEMKEKSTAFCRCGHSANKPYCDGQHKLKGFKD